MTVEKRLVVVCGLMLVYAAAQARDLDQDEALTLRQQVSFCPSNNSSI